MQCDAKFYIIERKCKNNLAVLERYRLATNATRGRFPMWLTTLGLIDFHFTPRCPSIAGRATPQSENGQLAFLRIGCVRAFEYHTGDSGVTETRVTEVDDQSKR